VTRTFPSLTSIRHKHLKCLIPIGCTMHCMELFGEHETFGSKNMSRRMFISS
jgi:hypothetical protein